jgi:hypothetical protein
MQTAAIICKVRQHMAGTSASLKIKCKLKSSSGESAAV